MLHVRHGKGVMGGIPFLEFFAPFEHWEIDDEGKSHHVRISQFQGIPEPDAQCAKHFIDYFRNIGNEQKQIAGACAGQCG